MTRTSVNVPPPAPPGDIFNQEPLFTDLPTAHEPAEVGQDSAYALRTTTKKYRTTPLRALWQHAPYFHDGGAATLADVVEHYQSHFDLGLTDQEKFDLIEYLKSI